MNDTKQTYSPHPIPAARLIWTKAQVRTRFADTPEVAEIVCCALDTANAVLSQRECARSSNRYQTLFGIDPDCQMHARILKANTTRHVSSMMAAITAAAWTAHTRKDG